MYQPEYPVFKIAPLFLHFDEKVPIINFKDFTFRKTCAQEQLVLPGTIRLRNDMDFLQNHQCQRQGGMSLKSFYFKQIRPKTKK
jgi:hypothetical protein